MSHRQKCRQAKRAVRQLERSARSLDTSEATASWYAKRHEYRSLCRRKREHVWQSKVDAEKAKPRQLCALSTHCSVAAASRHAMTSTPSTSMNISMAKSSLCDRLPLMPLRRYCRRIPPNSVTFIQSVNADDVVTVIHALSDKSCVLDPPPTAPLKADVDVIAPFLT